MIRVLVVEKYQGMRQGLYELLADLPEVEAVDIAGDRVEASRLLCRTAYDVIVLGLEDTEHTGLGMINAFRKISPLTAVLLLGLSIDTRLAMWPIRFGAMGYIPKECIVEELPLAIRTAIAGKPYVSRFYHSPTAPSWLLPLAVA